MKTPALNAFQRLEQFARLQKPPATAAAGPTNVYVANEPGGRASVHVTGKLATVSLPFATPGNYSITGQVTSAWRPHGDVGAG